jgi:hypothetical protein
MKFLNSLILIFMCLLVISCGNKKPNKLPDGTKSISGYPFPPNEDYDWYHPE